MKTSSLAPRALLALLLMVGFYSLALGVIGGLLYVPYAEWAYAHRVHAKVAILCLGGAVTIALAIRPRFDHFEEPGPALDPAAFPQLFRRIDEVARRTGQAMPSQVFLVSDLNAFVAHRGGVMGLGSRRIMGLGLPLLQVLSRVQFEAVLAHELGHYHGGDTRLGPWIHKTRSALGRTLEQLGEDGVLHLPFKGYARLFLRLTQAISRAQEYAADRLAATAVGGRALIDGLKRVHVAAPAFDVYWSQEVTPVLNGGYRAPLSGGFRAFLGVPHVKQAMDTMLDGALKHEQTDPYDSHPALPDRIAALQDLARNGDYTPDDAQPAIELLGDVDRAEGLLLAFMGGTHLTPLGWSEVAERVFLPRWRKRAANTTKLLEGTTLGALPDAVQAHREALVRAQLPKSAASVPVDLENELIAGALGAAISVTLVDAGWSLRTDVGEPVSVHSGDQHLEPFNLCLRIGDRAVFSQSAWDKSLQAAGVDELPLRVVPREA